MHVTHTKDAERGTHTPQASTNIRTHKRTTALLLQFFATERERERLLTGRQGCEKRKRPRQISTGLVTSCARLELPCCAQVFCHSVVSLQSVLHGKNVRLEAAVCKEAPSHASRAHDTDCNSAVQSVWRRLRQATARRRTSRVFISSSAEESNTATNHVTVITARFLLRLPQA
jgi:hypothetical protein